MLRDVLTHAHLGHFAIISLVLFLLVFLAIVAWALTRPRWRIEQWAAMPLQRDDAPSSENQS